MAIILYSDISTGARLQRVPISNLIRLTTVVSYWSPGRNQASLWVNEKNKFLETLVSEWREVAKEREDAMPQYDVNTKAVPSK